MSLPLTPSSSNSIGKRSPQSLFRAHRYVNLKFAWQIHKSEWIAGQLAACEKSKGYLHWMLSLGDNNFFQFGAMRAQKAIDVSWPNWRWSHHTRPADRLIIVPVSFFEYYVAVFGVFLVHRFSQSHRSIWKQKITGFVWSLSHGRTHRFMGTLQDVEENTSKFVLIQGVWKSPNGSNADWFVIYRCKYISFLITKMRLL